MHGLDEYDSEARWYYPAIMRTTTIDPLAEKYYSISPYAWCANNPVSRIDPDGKEWKMTKSVVAGVTIYSFDVSAVLYNNSDSKIDMEKLKEAITAQVMGVFNFKGDGFQVSMDFNLKVVNSIDDISETDHVFQVVSQESINSNYGKETQVLGNTQINGLNIKLGVDVAKDIISGKNQRTAAHELAHTGGLLHIDNNKKGVGFDVHNLMMTLPLAMNHGGNEIVSNRLREYQVNQIYENRNNVNQNSPVTPLKGYYLKNGILFTPIIYKCLRL